MTQRNSTVNREPRAARVLGNLRGERAGPSLLLIAGIHGNELAGVVAAKRVFEVLGSRDLPLCGEVLAVAGNLRALDDGERFVDVDLNRHWTPDVTAHTGNEEDDSLTENNGSPHENHELRELQTVIDAFLRRKTGAVFAVDMHTTSNSGAPFATVGDTLRNRHFASHFHSAVVLGLEEELQGTMLEYLTGKGFITMGFEAGQHADPTSVKTHEAVVWVSLVAAGVVSAENLPEYADSVAYLAGRRSSCPRFFEIQYRHAITGDDAFHMQAGFTNFDAVSKGQLLGHDRSGEVHSPRSGLILMPLYQGQGSDGFFVGKAVRPFWLRLSAWLRRLHLERTMHWLPGVWRVPDDENVLRVDTRVARIYPLEIFHLLGFRRRRARGRYLYVSRRRHDL